MNLVCFLQCCLLTCFYHAARQSTQADSVPRPHVQPAVASWNQHVLGSQLSVRTETRGPVVQWALDSTFSFVLRLQHVASAMCKDVAATSAVRRFLVFHREHGITHREHPRTIQLLCLKAAVAGHNSCISTSKL